MVHHIPPQTKLLYQHDADLHQHITEILAIKPVSSLSEVDQSLFKTASAEDDYIISVVDTIFYAQGGGQPSDTGFMSSCTSNNPTKFIVSAVRHGSDGQIFHLGHFEPENSQKFNEGDRVQQEIDVSKRLLHSRLHTGGHVLGLAVSEIRDQIPNFAEGKAQHYPKASSVEFRGLIDGKFKSDIEARANALVARNLPVKVCWWCESEMRERCVDMPEDMTAPEGELLRAVDVVGIGAYPCGGTHVHHTGEVGHIVVRKITRQKGISRVSYDCI